MSDFDLDRIIAAQADVLRVKHEKPAEPAISREIRRVSQEQNARERTVRSLAPKLVYRESSSAPIWTPKT